MYRRPECDAVGARQCLGETRRKDELRTDGLPFFREVSSLFSLARASSILSIATVRYAIRSMARVPHVALTYH